MSKLEITYIPLAEIIPYEKNPRKNDKAVEIVAKSIKEFSFMNPIILDKDNVIIAGHTRLKAAQLLNLQEVPVIWAEDLTEEQVKAFRIMDNRSQEYTGWDFELLKSELNELKDLKFDLDLTGFKLGEINNLDKVHSEDKAWVGMPEFEKRDDIYKIIIQFKTREDREDFDKKYKFDITKKQEFAWSMWYPKYE